MGKKSSEMAVHTVSRRYQMFPASVSITVNPGEKVEREVVKLDRHETLEALVNVKSDGIFMYKDPEKNKEKFPARVDYVILKGCYSNGIGEFIERIEPVPFEKYWEMGKPNKVPLREEAVLG
jgi:hypothetical protein